MMPQNISTLTRAELARMEGRERQNIEARIQVCTLIQIIVENFQNIPNFLQWLKNIQVMLDASVMMMQQYSSVANRFPCQFDRRDVETQTSVSSDEKIAEVKSEDGAQPESSYMEKPSTSEAPTSEESAHIETKITANDENASADSSESVTKSDDKSTESTADLKSVR